jgi:phage terminase large subunit-like protein
MTGSTAPRALKAGHPEAFDDRPEWLKALDGDESFDWARQAWNTAAAQPGAWFDHQLADHIIADWPNWATLTLDRFAGVKFILNTWQEVVVRLLVGWMTSMEIVDPLTKEPQQIPIRLFRRLMLWIPRKNGKSEFLAALALLFFIIDGVPQGEGYVFARKEKQARVVFSRMAAMIANDPEFKSEVIAYAKTLYVKRNASLFTLLSGSDAGLHGMSPTVIVGDEMHEWSSNTISETLRQGTGGRLQPIELYASTAGRKSAKISVGQELYDESKQILEGRRVDPTTLVVIYAANDNDDPGSEETWRRANPSLGLSPTKHFLRLEYDKAVGNPRAMAHFKCYHLGIWAEETVRWLPLPKWDACNTNPVGWKEGWASYRGRPCFLAFDVSSTTDITAMVLVFPPTEDDPNWRVLARFWIPELQVDNRVAEGAPIDRFIALGALETTTGDYVDQNAVGEAILEACRDFDVQQIGYDSWNAAKLITDLQTAGKIVEGAPGIPPEKFIELRQGIRTLGEPSKHFERLIYAGLFDHGGHPVLRWMAGHVVVHFDRNLNFAPAKDKSSEKIDGIVASVMAVGLACNDNGPTKKSFWDTDEMQEAA